MNKIRFGGKDKKECVKRAMTFYYDNFKDEMTLKHFLDKCRYNKDEKVLIYYINMEVAR